VSAGSERLAGISTISSIWRAKGNCLNTDYDLVNAFLVKARRSQFEYRNID
jgi:hypothetical protein